MDVFDYLEGDWKIIQFGAIGEGIPVKLMITKLTENMIIRINATVDDISIDRCIKPLIHYHSGEKEPCPNDDCRHKNDFPELPSDDEEDWEAEPA